MLRNRIVTAMIVLGALTTFAIAADTYNVDPVHSTIIFKVKHADVSNYYGRINSPTGTVVWDDADPTKSSFTAEMKVENIDTGNPKRDGHSKSPDFFSEKEFPNITFKSTAVKKGAKDNMFEVAGDLTMHGVTKPVTLMLEKIGAGTGPMGTRIGFDGTLDVKKSDYNIKGVNGVGDDIHIMIDIEAVKPK